MDRTMQWGKRIGEFTVESELAAGGFGVIYLARSQLGRRVALKVLRAEWTASPDLLARFQREFELVRSVQHPNIVKVLGFGSLPDGRPFYAMELLEGRDLEKHLAERGRLPLSEAVLLVQPLASALDTAHSFGVVHRDVKAGNVFITAEGRPVLLDFGIAKLLDADPVLTASRQALGTPGAMAPEQIEGKEVDGRTDVYALGALVYHMLTGQPPFHQESATLGQHMHRFARRPLVSAMVGDYSAVDGVVARAMSISPDDRYDSAGAMARALGQVVEGGGETRRLPAVAVHVEVIDETDPMPAVWRYFEAHGFVPALSASWSAIFVHALDDQALAAASVSFPGVRVKTRIGEMEVAGKRVVGGDVLDLGGWESV
jgi:serine/threonine-protein kinase